MLPVRKKAERMTKKKSLVDALANIAREDIGKGKITKTSDGALVEDVILEESDQDVAFAEIFKIFNLDPEQYSIINDTVVIKSWQSASGEWRFSYGAKFSKRSDDEISEETIDSWRTQLKQFSPSSAGNSVGLQGVEFVSIADPQIGKEGTQEALNNWRSKVEANVSSLANELASNSGPRAIHIGFMGDEHENVVNSYSNQSHTIELNRSKQLEVDFDMRVWTIRQYSSLGLPISVSSVISNHGLWTRNGGKGVVTTDGDNSSTHIARQVKKLFDELEPFTGLKIDWTIADESPAVTLDLDGVGVYATHGYIEKGRGGSAEVRMRNAMERQILGRTEELGSTKVYIAAHYHHFYSAHFEGRTIFGCPALEAERSSKWMYDQYGVWSKPGILTVRIDNSYEQGWSGVKVY